MPDIKTRETNHISTVGVIVLAMAFISLMVVLWTAYQDRQETACQQKINSAFFQIQRERAILADADRAAIRTLVEGVGAAISSPGPDNIKPLFVAYDRSNKLLDEQRALLVYPDEEKICQ